MEELAEKKSSTIILFIKPGYGKDLKQYNLLPCPFCGEKDDLEIRHLKGSVVRPAYKVCCDNCGASVGYTDNNCIEDWNERVL